MQYLRAGWSAAKLARTHGAGRRDTANELAARLRSLRGLPQKVGQVLSMSEEPTVRDALAPLRGSGNGLAFDAWRDALREAWGVEPDTHCDSIAEEGLAASLGQVHRARLQNGEDVAIKVRFPGIVDQVRTDLASLGAIGAPVGFLRSAFDVTEYRRFLEDALDEELDYRVEAENQVALGAALADTGVVVPRVRPELVRESVLVSAWESGESLDVARTWDAASRKALGRCLTHGFFTAAFDHGLLHADPHPGNYGYRRTPAGPEVVLYDHGCVHRISARERLALLALVNGAVERDAGRDPFPLFLELGFDATLLAPLRSKLAAVVAVLFEPFTARSRFDLRRWNRGPRIAGILGEDRTNLRAAGPPGGLFLMRAFEGLFFHLRELGEPADLARPMRTVLDRHAAALEAFEAREPHDPDASFAGLATTLAVRVSEAGRDKVALKLPASAVERLDEFLGPDEARRIAERGVTLDGLVDQVRARGYAPQEIFRLKDGERVIEVRLE